MDSEKSTVKRPSNSNISECSSSISISTSISLLSPGNFTKMVIVFIPNWQDLRIFVDIIFP